MMLTELDNRPPLREILKPGRMIDLYLVAGDRNENGTYRIVERASRPYPSLPPFWSLERRNWPLLALLPCFLLGLVTMLVLDSDWDARTPGSDWMGPRSFWNLLIYLCNPQSGWMDYVKSLVAGKPSFHIWFHLQMTVPLTH